MAIRGVFLLAICATGALAQVRITGNGGGGTPSGACQDFYQHACGAWLAANPIPKAEAAWGQASELRERNTATLRSILEEARVPTAGRSTVNREIGDFYEACMDTEAIDRRGTAGLAEAMARIAKVKSPQSLRDAIVMLHRDGIHPFWVLSSQPDPDHSTMMQADISQAGFSLPGRAYYVRQDARSTDIRTKWREHIAAMFVLLGDTAKQAAGEAAAVVKLETEVAQASLDRQDQIDPTKTTHRVRPAELGALMPHFDWARYLKAMSAPDPTGLNVSSPDYLRAVDKVLAGRDLAPVRSYLRWRLLTSSATRLAKEFDELNFRFYGTVLSGVEERKPRWWRCTQAADSELGEALGQEFVARSFGRTAKDRVIALVHELEISLEEDIRELSWMSEDTRAQALRKLRQLNRKFGYPEHWIDYSSVKIARNDYLGNVERLNAFLTARDLAKIGKPVDPAEWDMTPPTVNASYEPPTNSINFPAGILQPPLFSVTASDAQNLGAIGMVIGHELTHGYDNNGRRYDADGNLRDWWTPADNKVFEDRAQCFVEEYSSFDFAPGLKGNGQLTLGENIADNGGMRIAYRTLQRLLSKTPGAAEQRDADGLTPEQRFFTAFAESWCQNIREETARNSTLTDEHSLAKWRVNGTVQNMPEFQKAFACPANEHMVRAQACRVW